MKNKKSKKAARKASKQVTASKAAPKHKLQYPVGQAYTLGKPTQERTGLGKTVTITGYSENGKQVVVADREKPSKTATIKFANLGSLVLSAVGQPLKLANMITGTPWKERARKRAAKITAAMQKAYTAYRNYATSVGDQVSGGKARRLRSLENALNKAVGNSGFSHEQIEASLAS